MSFEVLGNFVQSEYEKNLVSAIKSHIDNITDQIGWVAEGESEPLDVDLPAKVLVYIQKNVDNPMWVKTNNSWLNFIGTYYDPRR